MWWCERGGARASGALGVNHQNQSFSKKFYISRFSHTETNNLLLILSIQIVFFSNFMFNKYFFDNNKCQYHYLLDMNEIHPGNPWIHASNHWVLSPFEERFEPNMGRNVNRASAHGRNTSSGRARRVIPSRAVTLSQLYSD